MEIQVRFLTWKRKLQFPLTVPERGSNMGIFGGKAKVPDKYPGSIPKKDRDDPKGYKVDKLLPNGQTAGTPVTVAKAKDAHARDKALNGNRSGMSNGTTDKVEDSWAHLRQAPPRRH